MIYFSAASSRSSKTWSDAVDICKETWKHTLRPDDELWFVFGNTDMSDMPETYMGIQATQTGDEIHYDIPDSYHKIIFKTVLNMRDFLKTNHQFYVRTHTGSYLHLGLMHDLCLRLPNTNTYAGFIGYNQESNTYFASGACFVMSRDLVEMFVETFPQVKEDVSDMCDDLAIGNIITKRLCIPIIELPRVTIFEQLMFNPQIAHYYFTKESGKKMEYYRIVHHLFTSMNAQKVS